MDAKMLDGKVAIISGASYGMGQTMAELYQMVGGRQDVPKKLSCYGLLKGI